MRMISRVAAIALLVLAACKSGDSKAAAKQTDVPAAAAAVTTDAAAPSPIPDEIVDKYRKYLYGLSTYYKDPLPFVRGEGKWLYGAMELSNEVLALEWDAKEGTMKQFQAVKTLPADFTEPNTAAEIAVREDGKFLYVSNRGHDSIVVYAIDARTGELTLKQRVPSRGKVPRYFTFDPTGHWLIVSNQEGGNLSVYSVDRKTGELAAKGEPVAIVKPMGVVFLD